MTRPSPPPVSPPAGPSVSPAGSPPSGASGGLGSGSSSSSRDPRTETTARLLASVETLRRRYTLALLGLALLYVLGELMHQIVTESHASIYASEAALLGRQRMLSQRLSKAALAAVRATELRPGGDPATDPELRARVDELRSVIDQFRGAHAQLGASRGSRSSALSSGVHAGYMALGAEYEPLVESGSRFLRSIERGEWTALPEHLSVILAHEGRFLDGMERLVAQYGQEAAIGDRRLSLLSLAVLVAFLALLVLEARWVVRPALTQLRAAADTLACAWDVSRRTERERSAFLRALPDLMIRYTDGGAFVGLLSEPTDSALAAELRDRPLSEALPTALYTRTREGIARALRSGQVESVEWPLVLKGDPRGDTRHFEARLAVLREGEILAVVRDVTTQRHVERRVFDAVDHEKQRIGRDLHDGICQNLAGLSLMLQSARSAVLRGRALSAEQIELFITVLDRGLADARGAARGLSPAALVDLGLAQALRELCNTYGSLHAIECECSVDIDDPGPSPDAALQIYRIAQESLSNAVRHGRARRISLTLRTEAEALVLSISDNGTGISASRPGVLSGMGLRIMASRARCLGAELLLERLPSGGTVVRCRFLRSMLIEGPSTSSGTHPALHTVLAEAPGVREIGAAT